MAAEPPQQQQRCRIEDDAEAGGAYRLQKFRLYETRSNFYMIGRDKNRTFCRVLKIDRSDPSELNMLEDPTTYTEQECCELLNRIHEGNVASGGLKFVTACYGIIGFIKFLGPFYMLIITKRRKIGDICGHAIYSISKSNMIPIPNSQVQTNMAFSKSENRYKKLLCVVDLTKDFFFSYSYDVMRSLQKNLCDQESGQSLYDTMFVWNEYLTRGIRNNLKNTLWTVALVHGFFHQEKLSFLGKQFWFTLIARRSRHYAGTRYLKRGVNEKGRVANDVETEQIVIEDVPEGCPVQISSIVQNRGSIPLFWSQETSRLNLKPDITLLNRDPNYEATKLHFENLVKRYGNPIIILNLIKTYEKKPRERILRAEFANAIRCINKTLPAENRLRFLHWDLHKHFRSISANVLELLTKVAVYTVDLTGIFYCQVSSISRIEGPMISSYFGNSDSSDCSSLNFSNNGDDADSLETEISSSSSCSKLKLPLFQKGVLRTNCIDCLDRTNVAQYAYGLVALGRQLHSMGYMESENIELHDPLADDLMRIYETMGDTLALQYGGSAAHNKIFSERRGQWKAATQSQEFLRTLQRYYSNAYIDAEKQDAINVFLGYFQPQQGKPALWELDSDHHHSVGRHSAKNTEETPRSFIRRSLSDGNILLETNTPIATKSIVQNQPLSEIAEGTRKGLSESTFKISTCESDLSDERCTTSVEPTQLFKDVKEDDCPESDYICLDKHGDECNCSNFLDVDWLSSSGNSFDEDLYERSSISGLLQDNDNGQNSASTLSGSKSSFGRKEKKHARNHTDRGKASGEYSDDFIRWVNDGEMLSL